MIVTRAHLVLRVLDRMSAFHRRDALLHRDGWSTIAAAQDLVGIYLQGERPEDGAIAFYEDRFTVSCTCGTTFAVAYDQLRRAQPPQTKDVADPQRRVVTLTLKGGPELSLFVAGSDGKFIDAFEMTRLFMNLARMANKPSMAAPLTA